jgi:pyrroloquinoline-quinone synthase
MNTTKAGNMELWTPEVFYERMRKVGEESYYDKHPFHLLLNEGRLPIEAIRVWIRNRFYYQGNIPVKDAYLLAKSPREVRKIWLHRITDHDGDDAAGKPGGIQAWVRLDLGVSGQAPAGFETKPPAEQLSILQQHETVLNQAVFLPGVRSAVDSYVGFVREARWEMGVASSLTEMFAPDLMVRRLAALEKQYPAIPSWAYDYFRNRPPQARRDCGEAWTILVARCTTPELQREAVAALQFKCEVLWKMQDAILAASPDPGQTPHRP